MPRGTCRCPSGLEACDGRCIDINSDGAHCGRCGAPCAPGSVCVGGSCLLGGGALCVDGPQFCPGTCDTSPCPGGCVQLQTNPTNCGTCGTRCAPREVCQGGQCSCAEGKARCAGAAGCLDLQSDAQHCGACSTACQAGQVCVDGQCRADCGSGGRMCGGRCVDPQADARHCGACGTTCGPDERCLGGECVLRCEETRNSFFCLDACYDGDTSPLHCGPSCGETTQCTAKQACVASLCVCGEGLSECPADSGRCVNVNSDPRFCGDCDTPCDTGQACTNGECVNP
ncbi:MAG: hypothetical protein IPL40_02025 [Proteobacteria bacterium]|nr:hypothetical protein [Pseudomonadota bacterium]